MFTETQLKKNDIDTLKRWLRFRLGGYVVAVKHINANTLVYRGVTCPVRPDTVKRISYPPPEKVMALQRLNREGQPRFYCSVAGPAVFSELHAQGGDLIALSEWEVTEPLWIYNLGYHPDALRRIGTQEQHISMRRQLTHSISNETRENEKLRRKLSEAFTRDVRDGEEYRYKQSIAIIESLSEEVQFDFPEDDAAPKHKKIAGTVYPAIRLRGDADNLVFLPEFVDSSLKIKSVRYIRVEAADAAASSYTFLTIGFANTFSGDTIEWLPDLGTEDARRRSRIALEDGHWVLRDGYNHIYDLH